MRASALIVLLLAGCGAATAPVAAPKAEPAPDALDVAATSKLDAGTPAPAAPSPPVSTPAGAPVLNKVTVPGEPAPNLAIGKEEQAAIDGACKKLCKYPPCTCDATRPMPQFMLLRQLSVMKSSERGYGWYVLQRTDKGWITLEDAEMLPGGDEVTSPHVACSLRGPDPLPEGLGLIGVRLPDLNLDGRPDLLLECREDGDHDLHYCLSDSAYCHSIPMRMTLDGELRLDVDLEFRNGWFIRTVRVDRWKHTEGNIPVDGIDTPDPAPPR